MPVTVLMNRSGLALQCGRFFFHPTAASAFKSFIKNSLRLCQLAVLPHSWLLQTHPLRLDFHSIRAKRVKVQRFAFICRVASVLCEGLNMLAYCIQKVSSILMKHLALIKLVVWCLNKKLKARMTEHQRNKMSALDMLWNGNTTLFFVIVRLKIQDEQMGNESL